MDIGSEKMTVALFDEILEFMLSQPTVEQIIDLRLPAYLENRVHDLLEQNRGAGLSDDERSELNEFLRIDHFFTMLKTRARHKSTHLNE